MKGSCTEYPNKGVKIDPRSITSARMPESLKIFTGYLKPALYYLMAHGYLQKKDIDREGDKIRGLPPYNTSNNKLLSSHWFRSDIYRLEFFRTSRCNYKVYGLKIIFIEEHSDFV